MGTYRKRPVEITAYQLDSMDYDGMCAIATWCRGVAVGEDNHVLRIDTLEGPMFADPGDWIIKEPFPTSGRQFYPCKPDIFEATYEQTEPGLLP